MRSQVRAKLAGHSFCARITAPLRKRANERAIFWRGDRGANAGVLFCFATAAKRAKYLKRISRARVKWVGRGR
jgi:hypothetical protein